MSNYFSLSGVSPVSYHSSAGMRRTALRLCRRSGRPPSLRAPRRASHAPRAAIVTAGSATSTGMWSWSAGKSRRCSARLAPTAPNTRAASAPTCTVATRRGRSPDAASPTLSLGPGPRAPVRGALRLGPRGTRSAPGDSALVSTVALELSREVRGRCRAPSLDVMY